MALKPLADRIVIKVIEDTEQTSGGIFIPDSAKEKPQKGEVVAVGEGKTNEKGEKEPLEVKVGDVVEVKENSKNLAIIKSSLENRVHTPAFVEVDDTKLTGKLIRLPERSELNQEINESLIVEYYNRMG